MKIYQIHKIGGQWEDSYDYIIGSYLKKERAEEEKIKAEQEEQELRKQSKKCNECPYLYDAFVTKEELLKYCPKAKLEKDMFNDIGCVNYFLLWDESTFKIEEVEVIG